MAAMNEVANPQKVALRRLANRIGKLAVRGAVGTRDAIWPAVCLACERPVDKQGSLCPTCWGEMRFIERPYCAVMGSPFTYDLGEGALSAEAIADPPPFDRCRSVVLYDDVARRMVSSLKFSDRTELAPWMAQWMVRASDGMFDEPERVDVIPVPLHRRRLFVRRFNQSAEIARAVAALTGATYLPERLQRSRPTPQQVGLGRKERDANVRGAFRIPKGESVLLKGRHVVLVDDVYTTGATLKACARAVRRAGAAKVDCLTFARVATGVAVTEL
ncbi:ComF family protein [Ahrensia sp. R2A130]|uniref:ComF family protein n=1 Tax=Ahrensia sp. R2A130 TaxID=744979 RepID=UPI0001E0E0DF|nr:ComF family protein [Ahrensia sp. R2A130]EFL87953.1 competence protein F [Ahrensia sp. R2A130]